MVAHRRRLLIATAFLALSVPLIGEAASEYIYVPIADEFQLSIDVLNYLAIAPTMASLVAVFLAGALAVRFGRRRVLIWSAAVTCTGALLLSLAPSVTLIFAGRVLCGVGGVPLAVVGLSLVNVTFTDPAQRGRMFGVLAAVTPLVYILAPVAGSLIGQFLGWRFVPLLWLTASGVTIILAVRALPRTDATVTGSELITPLLAGVALATLCLAISLAGLGLMAYAIAAVATAAVVVALLLIILPRRPESALDLRALRAPGALLAAGAVIFLVAIDITYFVNLYIQYRYSLPLPYLALLAVLPELAGIAGSLIFGSLASRRGPGPSALIAMLAAAVLPLTILLLGPGSSVWLIVIACVVINFPTAGAVGPLTEYFMDYAPADGSDATASLYDALTNVRNVVLSAVVGLVAFAGFEQTVANGLVASGVPADRAAAVASDIRSGEKAVEIARGLPSPDDPLKKALAADGTTIDAGQYEALRLTALVMTVGGAMGAGMLGLSMRRRRRLPVEGSTPRPE